MKRTAAAQRKRRTTLTLPADSLSQAARIARAKHVNLSVVVAEALASGLRVESARERSAQVLQDYREAFAGFTAEGMMILDGIIPSHGRSIRCMLDPALGPFLFDTSAESWFSRSATPQASDWFRRYLAHDLVHISAVTVMERARGYSMLWRDARAERRGQIEVARTAYLRTLGHVWPVDGHRDCRGRDHGAATSTTHIRQAISPDDGVAPGAVVEMAL